MTVPSDYDFIGNTITESQFKNALTVLLNHIRQMSLDLVEAQGGNYSYATMALFDADKINVPAKSTVRIAQGDDAGLYTWDGSNLTKAEGGYYQIVNQILNQFITSEDSENLYEFKDKDGKVLAFIDQNGRLCANLKDLSGGYELPSHIIELAKTRNLHEFKDVDGKVLAFIDQNGRLCANLKDTSGLFDSILNTVYSDDSTDHIHDFLDKNFKLVAFIDKFGRFIVNNTDILAEIERLKLANIDSAVAVTDKTFVALNVGEGSISVDLDVEFPTDITAEVSGTCTFILNNEKVLKTNILLKIQGNGSRWDDKKNWALDFLNKNGDAVVIKLGDMCEADGLHLKAFWRDPSLLKDQGGYRLWKSLIDTLDYPYNKVNNIPITPNKLIPTMDNSDAKYFPYGIPCEVRNYGEFYGMYILRNKKQRENYALNKDTLTHIFLDSATYTAYLSEPFDYKDWEIRNPKMKGYDAEGEIPTKFTVVQTNIERLFNFTQNLSTMYASHKDYIVLEHWITWYLTCNLIGQWDVNGNNYNIMTWDGQHWSILPYDLDRTLGDYIDVNMLYSQFAQTSFLNFDIWPTFYSVYQVQIKAQYRKWRESGALSVYSCMKPYLEVGTKIPRKLLDADFKKWGMVSTQNWGVNKPTVLFYQDWFKLRLAHLDSIYLN
ncbi:CotH kinase family protein [uncultured Acinetobacter sp.]|uniref:CotH kinase family protein n=1 Tax=uncultured Acinetobacter sp. TaxID=165433 RepID=UPI00258EA21F|nr:CotH kinase family protein [uncultured Acinetobacter sp.]